MPDWLRKLLVRIGLPGVTANLPDGQPDTDMSQEVHYRVLFVCMGNICRSPTAEGVFRKLIAEQAPELVIHADSAGTHAYHSGEPPDPRAQRAALRRGVDISGQRARRVRAEDFQTFDYVLAMDELNYEVLRDKSPEEHLDRVRLFLEFAPDAGRQDVPDPYYGGSTGFEYVLDLVEEASNGLVAELVAHRRRAAR